MLWSLLRGFIFIAIVAALTLGVIFLWEMDTAALITVAGREYIITPLLGLILAVTAFLAVWLFIRVFGLLWATFRFLNGDETAISRYLNRRSERRGYQALSEGMLALAAGEGRLAIRKAKRAESYLQRPELTNLIIAQGAEMAGDTTLATQTLKSMVTDDRTRFVGIRGLVKQKLEAGDTDTAMKLAEKGLSIRPQNTEIQDILLKLQTQDEDWSGARKTLAVKLKSGALPRDVHRRRDAVLALAHARDALAEGKIDVARAEAENANTLSPDLVPAAVMAARMSVEKGSARQATRIIRKAWDAAPHPDLAAAFAAIEPEESARARLARFRPLLNKHPGDPETRLLHAELLIAAEDFPKARTTLGDLPETAPDARSLTLMAAIERGEGSEDRVVRAWLAKAIAAPRGPQWVCEVDGKVYPEWQPITDGGFDTLTWKAAPVSDIASTDTSGILPLIVGPPANDPSEAEPEAEEADVVQTEDGAPAMEIDQDESTDADVNATARTA
ncbi:MAG: heme biosynthesis HemY N-terminal domain-containing protein [Pseudomonadota bacterium]